MEVIWAGELEQDQIKASPDMKDSIKFVFIYINLITTYLHNSNAVTK